MQAMGPEVAFLWQGVERQAWYGSQRPLSGSIQPSYSLYQQILLTLWPGKTLQSTLLFTILGLIYCHLAMWVHVVLLYTHGVCLVEFDIT